MLSELQSALELTHAVASARVRGHGPLYLVHALTARCNARCGFCAWNPDFYDPREQLCPEAIEQLYADARAAGFVGLSVWGGEPLVHPEFERLIGYAKRIGLRTHMVTNGFLLPKKMDAVLAHVDRLCISLDHPSAHHDTLRGLPGLFDRIVEGTREFRRRAPHKPLMFVCTLQKDNVQPETLRAMAALLKDLGALGIFNGMRLDAASDDPSARLDAYAPSPADLSRAFVTLEGLKREGYPILNSYTHLRKMQAGPPVYRCHWPKLMLPVEANGDVVDCMHWGTRPLGNVKTQTFREILASPRLRDLMGPAGEACHQCVSIHRVEVSAVWDGNLEPVSSWVQLGLSRLPRPSSTASATS